MASRDIMDEVAQQYVKLVLQVGNYDSDYVDAYYGPPEWQQEVKENKISLDEISKSATLLQERLKEHNVPPPPKDGSEDEEMFYLRYQYLTKQLHALSVNVRRLSGEKIKFIEEARNIYDVNPPIYPESHFAQVRKELASIIGGNEEEPLFQRYANFRKQFVIPKEKLDDVFQAAIKECKERSRKYIKMPDAENFTIEYVNNKAWSAYNWYKGNSFSLIQLNTDLPIYIDRAIDLAAHEGYPGHHVFNTLLEDNLVKKRNFVELSVYPLFSPHSFMAEGTANFGIKVAFPGSQKVEFERDVLYPLAGLDPALSKQYDEVQSLVAKLSHADNFVAQRYLDGEIEKEKAIELLSEYVLMEPQRAGQRLRFIEKYRAYVINYNLGQDMVQSYIESLGGTVDNVEKRWQEFARLISSPRLPSGIEL